MEIGLSFLGGGDYREEIELFKKCFVGDIRYRVAARHFHKSHSNIINELSLLTIHLQLFFDSHDYLPPRSL